MSLKTDIESIISSGVDEAHRRIFFGRYLPNTTEGEGTAVDQVSIEYAIRGIIKMVDQNPKKPVEIHMNSYGGDPYSMLYLHDLILSSPCQFKFYGGGAIMSAATWIMAVCDERYLYKNARVMIHAGSLSLEGTFTDVEIQVAEERYLQDELENIYAHNSRMPKKFWAEVCKRDLYLSAEEAITLGLADKIIEPRRRGSFRKMRQAAMSEKIPTQVMKKVVSKLYGRIQYPDLKEIVITDRKLEEIDETLIMEENTDGSSGQSAPSIAGDSEDSSNSGIGSLSVGAGSNNVGESKKA